MSIASRAAAAACALASSALVGCAPERGEAYDAAFAAGERAFHSGRWREAAAAWEGAAGKARRVKDRDEARFLEARSLERASAWAEARATYERIQAESPDGPRTGRAAFEIAHLEIDHGDPAKGWAMLDAASQRFSKHGLARVAIHRLVEHALEQGGEAAVAAYLDAHEATFRGTEPEDVILYERARSLERAGRLKEAHDLYLSNAHTHAYPSGGLADDSFSRAAAIDEQAGRFDEAVTHLREILTWREPSGYWASYERPRYADAQLRIAEIYRDRIKDRAAARREFDKLAGLHKGTLKRDLAVWAGARLALQDKDPRAACSLAKRLTDEFADSRYTPCAHELCSEAPRGKRACADYLLRQLKEDAGEVPQTPPEAP